jgi:hypothetical protein
MSPYAVIREAGPGWTDGDTTDQPDVAGHAMQQSRPARLLVVLGRSKRRSADNASLRADAGVAVTAIVVQCPERRHSAINTRRGLAWREAAVRRSCAERLAGANALQVNQWPNPRCSVRGPLIVNWPARIAPPSSARPK